MTTSSPNRQPEGIAAGGEFAPKTRAESQVALTPVGRTPFGGYELRGYKSAGSGMEGNIWSATIYRDGKAVLTVLDEGNGGELRFTSKVTGYAHQSDEQSAFEKQAALYHPASNPDSYWPSGGIFAETLVFSAELDKFCKRYNVTREFAVQEHITAGVITEDDRELFANPDSVPRV